jgi:hypothetical protein
MTMYQTIAGVLLCVGILLLVPTYMIVCFQIGAWTKAAWDSSWDEDVHGFMVAIGFSLLILGILLAVGDKSKQQEDSDVHDTQSSQAGDNRPGIHGCDCGRYLQSTPSELPSHNGTRLPAEARQ